LRPAGGSSDGPALRRLGWGSFLKKGLDALVDGTREAAERAAETAAENALRKAAPELVMESHGTVHSMVHKATKAAEDAAQTAVTGALGALGDIEDEDCEEFLANVSEAIRLNMTLAAKEAICSEDLCNASEGEQPRRLQPSLPKAVQDKIVETVVGELVKSVLTCEKRGKAGTPAEAGTAAKASLWLCVLTALMSAGGAS